MKKVLPQSIRTHYPFRNNRENYLSIDSNHLHFVDEGKSKQTVLMLHGNPSWSFMYRNLILELRENFRCVAPDHMGCGLSDKPKNYNYTIDQHIQNLITLIDHLSLSNVHLIIHDWGGVIGLGAALKRPNLIKSLTILNTAAFPSEGIPKRINICKNSKFGKFLVQGLNVFTRGAVFCGTSKKMDKEIAKGYLFPYGNWHSRKVIYDFVQEIPDTPQHRNYKLIKSIDNSFKNLTNKPSLICWGNKDFCFTQTYLKKWAEKLPQSKILTLENAGHYLMEDSPGEVCEAIGAFLERN